jgi:hypothetical protein
MYRRHTRDFSKISVNKINNLRKSNYSKIFRRAKNIFSKKKVPCNRYTVFWRIRPKLAFQKSAKTPIKKVLVGFFGNCLRMQKPKIKLTEFGPWDVALVCVCGPESRKHSPLPQSGLYGM